MFETTDELVEFARQTPFDSSRLQDGWALFQATTRVAAELDRIATALERANESKE